jgi:hypothetical protein
MKTITRKNLPWSGWKNERPSFAQKTVMMKKCGQKCFLGKKSFPICKKNTCKISKKGVYSAYVRSREYSSRKPTIRKYRTISAKAKKMIDKMNKYK